MNTFSTIKIIWSLIFLTFNNHFLNREENFLINFKIQKNNSKDPFHPDKKNHDTLIVKERCVIDIPRSEKYSKYLDSICTDNNDRALIDMEYVYYCYIADSLVNQKNIKLISLWDEKYIRFINTDKQDSYFRVDTLWDK